MTWGQSCTRKHACKSHRTLHSVHGEGAAHTTNASFTRRRSYTDVEERHAGTKPVKYIKNACKRIYFPVDEVTASVDEENPKIGVY